MQIIDAHHHFWDLDRNYLPWLKDEPPIRFRYGDYSALKRNYLPEDYRRDTGRYEVVGSVYIETEFDPEDPLGEMSWLGELRSAHGLPTVAVAQAWLDRPDAPEVLAAHGATSFVRGIRHKPAAVAHPDQASRGAAGSMDDPRWRDGFALLEGNGLSFDLQTPWWHLDAAADLARDFPGTEIILNHTGLPSDRSEAGLAAWRAAIGKLADRPNVAIKVSGLGIPHRPWTVEDNRPVVLAAIESFGVDRVMFASNFPVDSLVADFETIFDGFDAITRGFDDQARSAMFRDNACRIYRMDE
jgi:predicted TIM-barrel fold metal-dependent hydrolase